MRKGIHSLKLERRWSTWNTMQGGVRWDGKSILNIPDCLYFWKKLENKDEKGSVRCWKSEKNHIKSMSNTIWKWMNWGMHDSWAAWRPTGGDHECKVKWLSLFFQFPSLGEDVQNRQSGFLCDFIKLREKGKIVEKEVYQRVSECLIRKFIWMKRGVRTQESVGQLEVEVLMGYRSLWA